MSYGLKDLFVGVIYVFVIFLPGALLLAVLLLTLAPELDLWPSDPGGWLAFLGASFLLGHLVSLVGATIEDALSEKWRQKRHDRRVSDDLRAAAERVVSAKLPRGLAKGDPRRWAAVLLREEESPAVADIERKDADRRFFRNVAVVLVVAAVLFFGVGRWRPFVADAGDLLRKMGLANADFLESTTGLAVVALVLAVLCAVRYMNQDGGFTLILFESLVAAHPDLAAEQSDQATLELRWFLDGEVPEAVSSQFDTPEARLAEEQIDWYRKGTGAEVGIKIRDGRLEIKNLTGEERSGKWTFERWTKRRLGPKPSPPVPQKVWLEVAKTRRLRKFILEANQLVEVAADVRPEAGCQVELTALCVAGRPAWTLGFEAFGASREQLPVLDVCVQQVLREIGGEPKTAVCSGYPAWIQGRA